MAAVTPITQRAIHTYTCTDLTKPALAIIDGCPWLFYDPSPLRAKKKADEWRRDMVRQDKLIPAKTKAQWLGEAQA
ncbi:hypothetical protein [Sulfitobacter sp. M23508]|uniref:hypothetical protein n=1 Tax=Sulfitobacter sp. M23508 TaxID=3368577 RepID=UPI003745DEAD